MSIQNNIINPHHQHDHENENGGKFNNFNKNNYNNNNNNNNNDNNDTTTTATKIDMKNNGVNNNNNNNNNSLENQLNGNIRLVPIQQQQQQINNNNNNNNNNVNDVVNEYKTKPRNSIISITNSQKSTFLLRTKKFLKGICLTILSGLFFSITTLVVKYVKNVSPGTTAGFRYLGIIILSFPLALESTQPIFGSSDAYLWIALRGLAGGTSVFCRYSALHYMSMADSTIIILSMPVFVFVFARIFLKEQFGRYHVLALILSIVGIIFASKLEIIFGKSSSSSPTEVMNDNLLINVNNKNATTLSLSTTTTTTTTPLPISINNSTTTNNDNENKSILSDQMIGTLYSLGATFVGCFVYVIIRKLKDVDKYVILFNFSIISMIEMIIIDYFFYEIQLPMNDYTPYLIVLIGILSFYAQLLLTRAIQIEEAGVVSVVRTSSEAFFAFILQIIFFQQIPDIYTIIGAILVLNAVFLLSFRKYLIGLPDQHSTKKRFAFLLK